jgi:putative hydrolase of the HAD superfamily
VTEVRDIIEWRGVDHVLLDMDGTLLDRYFDDYFWEHLVPEKYAEKNNISFGKAKDELLNKYKVHEGTLNWTDLDFWSRELDLDIPVLKEQIKHLIEVHPYVEDFLSMLKRKGKRIFLVTNAHYKSIDLKLKKTAIGKYFDSIIASFDLGYPKEVTEFWRKAEGFIGFKKERTLLIDDTVDVLRTARDYGIKYLILKRRPNSKRGADIPKGVHENEFITVLEFKDLITS